MAWVAKAPERRDDEQAELVGYRSIAMSPGTMTGLPSIIVPCRNQREFTQLCLRALHRHTRRPWELIVINNGSTDDTAGYLTGVRGVSPVPVTVITSPENRGFPAAINQGLRAAWGEFLVLLHNDAVVTDAWLDQLIALVSVPIDFATGKGMHASGTAEAERRGGDAGPDGSNIGLLGPMSNWGPKKHGHFSSNDCVRAS